MEIPSKTKKAGVIIGVLSIAIVIAIILLPALLKPSVVAEIAYPKEHLFVDKTYLLKTDEKNDTVNVTCDIYLTNIWTKESGDIKAIAYVIETKNNFAVYKDDVEIGKIAADSTAELNVPVVLSNSSYKVEILLFENEKLVLTGELTISAHPRYSWEDIEHGKIAAQEWDLSNSEPKFVNIR